MQVKKLQRQLKEEVDLHVALADAVTQDATLILKSSMKLPHKVWACITLTNKFHMFPCASSISYPSQLMNPMTMLLQPSILQAQELLINIASLETTVSKLEKELNDLYYQLCHERNERLLAENNQGCLPSTSSDEHQSLSTCTCTWEEVSTI